MNDKNRSSLLLVPPQGSRIKAVRIRFWAVVILVAVVAIGVAGFIVPIDQKYFSRHDVEQSRNLKEQNERLHQNIGATLKLLSELKEQTARLEEKKIEAQDIIGLPLPEKPQQQTAPQKPLSATAAGAAELLSRIERQEKLVAEIAVVFEEKNNLFDTVPVVRPVDPAVSIVSKRYGMARDPFTGARKMHYGVDFAAEIGVPVIASASGTVKLVENDPVWGRRVIITHGRGLSTVYAHLGTVSVAQGKTVRRGDEIGTIGMTGLTTGPHLHYELWRGGEQIDPSEYFFPTELVAQR